MQTLNNSRDAYLVLWQWRLALSIRCLALALIAPHRRATRGGRHARHRADLGNLGLLGSAAQEWNHSHLSCWAEGREPKDTREGHKLEIWVCRWDHCINWNTETEGEVRIQSRRFLIRDQCHLGHYCNVLPDPNSSKLYYICIISHLIEKKERKPHFV